MANKCGRETFDYGGETYAYTFHGESHIADPQGNIVAKAVPEEEELLLAEIHPLKVTDVQWRMKFMRDWRSDLLQPLCEEPSPNLD
jgi:predicted amidohydrolase